MADIEETAGGTTAVEQVSHPAEVVRLTSTAREVLAELRSDDLDGAARSRAEAVYEQSLVQLSTLLSNGLQTELTNLLGAHRSARSGGHEPSTSSVPSEVPSTRALSSGELRVAEAQLAGWLDGLLLVMDESLAAQVLQAENGRDADHPESAVNAAKSPMEGTYL